MDYIENCVVCLKYLPTKALQEQGMCNDCDNKTDEIAREITKNENG
jgi:epoxyqueuosine reductase QueG